MFDRWNMAISKKGHVAGRRTYVVTADDDDDDPFSLEVEKGVADDLAFVAACEPKVDFVSAVALEQRDSGSPISVKLAVNQGVCLSVSTTFDKVFELLRRHARKGEEPPDSVTPR